jgi:hypothetical protein
MSKGKKFSQLIVMHSDSEIILLIIIIVTVTKKAIQYI